MSRSSAGPRKVVLGTSLFSMWGSYPGLATRLGQLTALVDRMADDAARQFPGARLDLAALPEFAVNGGLKGHCRDTAHVLDGPVLDAMADVARRHQCYLTVPLYLVEDRAADRFVNIVALLDRRGQVVGRYTFAHPSVREMENGLAPGGEFPVFDCDFGKVGIQICGDVHYDDGWRALARAGAELVLQIAQPATPVEIALRARQHRYFVLSATWRDAAGLYSPTGHALAELRGASPQILTTRIDLDYAILGWQPNLANGQLFTDRYGDRAGFRYWPEDDCGLFWSNDPKRPIARMLRDLGLVPLDKELRRNQKAQRAALKR
jgi:predicted amidohydrolase